MSYELLRMLKDKKVADSYPFYESCVHKLYFAETSYCALKNVIEQYQAKEKGITEKLFSDAFSLGVGTYKAHTNTVDYLGVEMDATSVMDKLTMEIMGLMHSFFDTFAQWINTALFGEDALPIKRATLSNVAANLQNFNEYTGTFINELASLSTACDYLYIADFNNTLKHRYQIYVDNRFELFTAKGSVGLPAFSKDGRRYLKVDALDTIRGKLDFCQRIFSDSKAYVETYYATSENLHVIHRCYNPKTYLFFDNKEDYEKMRSPKNHYYYLEVDPILVSDSYQIMLVCDRMDDPEDKSIECFNSDYSIIMLRETGKDNIIGLLRADDGEDFKLKDDHELQYRKYTPLLHGYEIQMFNAICSGESFTYHPYLSDAIIMVAQGDKK